MKRLAAFGYAFLSLSATAGAPAYGLEPSGTTVGVNPSSEASGAAGSRILDIQGPVYMGDEIKTDRNGQAQIQFVDDTRFVVGPSSKVVIDSFVFDPNKTAQDVGISAVKGAFRFITGASPKNAYAIRTPTMTVGVRGTAFDLSVRPGGESTIVVHEGATRLCDVNRQCREADSGDVVVAAPGGGFRNVSGLERQRRLAVFFPFVRPQAGLQPAFTIPSSVGVPANSDNDVESREPSRDRPPKNDRPDGRPPDGRPPR